MRNILLVVVSALLSALGLLYAQMNNVFPDFFAALNIGGTPTVSSGAIAPTGEPCTTPWGETIEHGQVFLSFAAETGSIASGGCVSRSTVCTNGSRSLDQEPLPAKTCTLQDPNNCELNGLIFANGTSREFFSSNTGDQNCTSELRTCKDGTFDGDESFTELSCASAASCPAVATGTVIGTGVQCPECPCLEKTPEIKPEVQETPKPEIKKPTVTTVKPTIKQVTTNTLTTPSSPSEPNCPSPTGGVRREPGQQGTLYKSSSVRYGETCEKVSVVCSFGSIRYGSKGNAGDVALGLSTSCSVAAAQNCDSACGPIAHGNQVVTFGQSIIPHGNKQTCEGVKIISSCNDGTLSPNAGSSCSCQIAPPAACTAPNGTKIAHGASITLYQEPQVQAVAGDGTDTCVRQRRKCFNGTFVDANDVVSPLTYQYPTCTVLPPVE